MTNGKISVPTKDIKNHKGDAYFPEIDKREWKEVSRENHKTLSFIEYEQKKNIRPTA